MQQDGNIISSVEFFFPLTLLLALCPPSMARATATATAKKKKKKNENSAGDRRCVPCEVLTRDIKLALIFRFVSFRFAAVTGFFQSGHWIM